MCETCYHVSNMKMIQIRNVPDDVHRRAKARAAMLGLTMSDYILRELERSLAYPTNEELFARIASRETVELEGVSIADLVREERDR